MKQLNLFNRIVKAIKNETETETKTSILLNNNNARYTADKPAIDIETYFTDYVASCISKRADAVSSIDVYAVKELELQELEILPLNHWINQLINYPNKILNITRKQLFQLIVKWLDYTGNCYLYLPVYASGKPANIWLLPANKVNIKTSASELIEYYELNNNGKLVKLNKNEIIHIKTLSVDSDITRGLLYGKPYLLNASLNAILTENEKAEFERKYYKREGISPLFMKTNLNYSDDALQKLKAEINNTLPNESAIKGILSSDVEFVNLDLSGNSQLQNTESNANIKKIASIFGIPYGLLDTESLQNRATAEINYYTFRNDTIEPLLQLIEQTISLHLQQYEKNVKLIHDAMTLKDEKQELETTKLYLDYGIITRNELRNELGKPELPNGNIPLKPANLVNWNHNETDNTSDADYKHVMKQQKKKN